MTVLVVDDESNIVSMLCDKFTLSGFTALGAVGPREALRLGQDIPGPIDLLLTDVVMPGMNGRELANRMARARPGLKVLFMSAYSDQVLTSHGVVPEGVYLIRKPLKLDEIVAKARSIIEN